MTQTETADRLPSGFRALDFTDGFIGNNGPVYVDRSGAEPVFGFRITDLHCNPMGMCHGGWVATMLDMVLPLSARFVTPDLNEKFLLTVTMTIDYLSPAHVGSWVEGRAQVLKRTGRMVFMQGLLTVDDDPIARGSGIFRIGPPGPPVGTLVG